MARKQGTRSQRIKSRRKLRRARFTNTVAMQQGDKLEPVKQEVDQAINNIDLVRSDLEQDVIYFNGQVSLLDLRLAALEETP